MEEKRIDIVVIETRTMKDVPEGEKDERTAQIKDRKRGTPVYDTYERTIVTFPAGGDKPIETIRDPQD